MTALPSVRTTTRRRNRPPSSLECCPTALIGLENECCYWMPPSPSRYSGSSHCQHPQFELSHNPQCRLCRWLNQSLLVLALLPCLPRQCGQNCTQKLSQRRSLCKVWPETIVSDWRVKWSPVEEVAATKSADSSPVGAIPALLVIATNLVKSLFVQSSE